MLDQYITPFRVMTEEASFKGHIIAHNPQGNNKALSGHQSQGTGGRGFEGRYADQPRKTLLLILW
jgi:hypothetical protein